MSEVRPIYDCGQGFLTDHVGLMVDRDLADPIYETQQAVFDTVTGGSSRLLV